MLISARVKALSPLTYLLMLSACGSSSSGDSTSERDTQAAKAKIAGYWTFSHEGETGIREQFIYITEDNIITNYYCKFGEPLVSGQSGRQLDSNLSETFIYSDDFWAEARYEYTDPNLSIHFNSYDGDDVLQNMNTVIAEPIAELPESCELRNFETDISNAQPESASPTTNLTITFDYKYRFILEQPASLVALARIEYSEGPSLDHKTIIDNNPDQGGNIIEGSTTITIPKSDLTNATSVSVSFGIQYIDDFTTYLHSTRAPAIEIQ